MRPLEPVALTIAGSDSGGGAGIQADLAAFAHAGVLGTTAVTCVTAQTPKRIVRVDAVAPEMVEAQIAAVCDYFQVEAIKIGMTYSAAIIRAIRSALDGPARGVPVVLDPVMRATSGAPLLEPRAEDALVSELLPRATVVTPNLAEAAVLAGMDEVRDVGGMEAAARRIARASGNAVLVKGGHLERGATEVLLSDGRITRIEGERLDGVTRHGTGCAFSAAMAAHLARGEDLEAAARAAKAYVAGLLREIRTA